jgi:hypothetical protein
MRPGSGREGGVVVTGRRARRGADICLPIPPAEEAHAIVQVLDRETARSDALVAKVRDAIEQLRELRAALISAAVTGKIDVREEAG